MKLLLKRLHRTNNSTIGELSIDGKFECYTLEDKEREARKGSGTVKVKGTVSLDAIKNRPRKDVTVADILETING